jgi:hypothetical protein
MAEINELSVEKMLENCVGAISRNQRTLGSMRSFLEQVIQKLLGRSVCESAIVGRRHLLLSDACGRDLIFNPADCAAQNWPR